MALVLKEDIGGTHLVQHGANVLFTTPRQIPDVSEAQAAREQPQDQKDDLANFRERDLGGRRNHSSRGIGDPSDLVVVPLRRTRGAGTIQTLEGPHLAFPLVIAKTLMADETAHSAGRPREGRQSPAKTLPAGRSNHVVGTLSTDGIQDPFGIGLGRSGIRARTFAEVAGIQMDGVMAWRKRIRQSLRRVHPRRKRSGYLGGSIPVEGRTRRIRDGRIRQVSTQGHVDGTLKGFLLQ